MATGSELRAARRAADVSLAQVACMGGLSEGHLARRVFTGVATGSSNRLAEAQTSHATDLVLKEFVAADPASAATLGRWMTDGSPAVLRVNAAGILAKVGDPGTTDTVIDTLRSDAPTRDL